MINRPRRPDGPVDESNRELSRLMADMPARPQQEPKPSPFPWGYLFTSIALAAVAAGVAYWVLAR